jgi:signal peptidase I
VAIPGDTFQIINRKVFTNGNPQKDFPGIQYSYHIFLKEGLNISDKVFERLGIYNIRRSGNVIIVSLTNKELAKIKGFKSVQQITESSFFDRYYQNYFPSDSNFYWTLDNFGPLIIPKKGSKISLDMHNLCLYERIISYYEKNRLEVKGNQIFINGEPVKEYTFKMDYYWMMGDNRHESLDARFWGFVPEDHIIGRPRLIWLSIDKNKKFLGKIRWNRIFKLV